MAVPILDPVLDAGAWPGQNPRGRLLPGAAAVAVTIAVGPRAGLWQLATWTAIPLGDQAKRLVNRPRPFPGRLNPRGGCPRTRASPARTPWNTSPCSASGAGFSPVGDRPCAGRSRWRAWPRSCSSAQAGSHRRPPLDRRDRRLGTWRTALHRSGPCRPTRCGSGARMIGRLVQLGRPRRHFLHAGGDIHS
jgi:hypothetical protein